MDRYKELMNEICALIENYGTEHFAMALIKWYGYKNLKEKGELKQIENLLKEY